MSETNEMPKEAWEMVNRDNFVTGGRNPNHDKCCWDCEFMVEDKKTTSHGWCALRNLRSVSITGGCDLHQLRKVKGE